MSVRVDVRVLGDIRTFGTHLIFPLAPSLEWISGRRRGFRFLRHRIHGPLASQWCERARPAFLCSFLRSPTCRPPSAQHSTTQSQQRPNRPTDRPTEMVLPKGRPPYLPPSLSCLCACNVVRDFLLCAARDREGQLGCPIRHSTARRTKRVATQYVVHEFICQFRRIYGIVM